MVIEFVEFSRFKEEHEFFCRIYKIIHGPTNDFLFMDNGQINDLYKEGNFIGLCPILSLNVLFLNEYNGTRIFCMYNWCFFIIQ